MTPSSQIRTAALMVRACATVSGPDQAEALRQIARRLDDAQRDAERMEADNAAMLAALPLHPMCDGVTAERMERVTGDGM